MPVSCVSVIQTVGDLHIR